MKIQIIIGTTRQNRFSEKAASFIYQELQKRKDIDTELVDLRDYPLPFFEEPMSPSALEAMNQEYTNPTVKKWTEKVSEADGYIIVTGEYNHGYPAVLKNALDYVLKGWRKKPVGFVSYGSSGGARAVGQLRQVVIELQMLPIKRSIQIPSDVYKAAMNEPLPADPAHFKSLTEGKVNKVEAFLEELLWLTKALKAAKNS